MSLAPLVESGVGVCACVCVFVCVCVCVCVSLCTGPRAVRCVSSRDETFSCGLEYLSSGFDIFEPWRYDLDAMTVDTNLQLALAMKGGRDTWCMVAL